MKFTKEQIKAYVQLLTAIYEAIAAAGEMGLPSGPLYTRLMGTMDLEAYNRAIDQLIELGLITRFNHLLKAVPNKTLDKKPKV